jgi:hypothetical protein
MSSVGHEHRGVLLFIIKYHGRSSRVLYWTGYGIVCPDLVTSNGVPKLVAIMVHHLREIGAEIEPVEIDPRGMTTEEDLSKFLQLSMIKLLREDGYKYYLPS